MGKTKTTATPLTIAAAAVGQRWQCREQTFEAKVVRISNDIAGFQYIAVQVFKRAYAGMDENGVSRTQWVYQGSERVYQVVNSKDAAYRTSTYRRGPKDLTVLLFDPNGLNT